MKGSVKNKGVQLAGVLMMMVLAGLPPARLSSERVSFQPASFLALNELHEQYPFLKLDENEIKYPGDSAAFHSLYRKMQRLLFQGHGKVNIVHIGGSHVQAGAIGHRMRELFEGLAWGVTEERGLCFPFRVAGTNSTIYTSSEGTGDWEGCRCAHNRHECNWGMSGMSVRTQTDSARLDFVALRSDSSLFRSDFVRLYTDMNERHFTPEWIDSAEIDSVWRNTTEGYYEWRFRASVDTLSWRFVKKDSLAASATVQGIYLGRDLPSVTYNEIGVNGASTRSYLRCDDMEAQLKSLNADLVVFGIGINDAYTSAGRFDKEAFKDRYDSLMQRFSSANPNTAFLFLTNNDSWYRKRRPNPNGKIVQEAMMELADRENAAVWDLFEVMGGYRSIDDWDRAGLAKNDRIHFTRSGYYLQAELMYAALMNDYGNWLALHSRDLSDARNQETPATEGYE